MKRVLVNFHRGPKIPDGRWNVEYADDKDGARKKRVIVQHLLIAAPLMTNTIEHRDGKASGWFYGKAHGYWLDEALRSLVLTDRREPDLKKAF